MKSISSYFCFIEPNLIRDTLLSGLEPVHTPDMTDFAAKGKVQFSQESYQDDNYLSWKQAFRAVTVNPDVMAYNGRQVYVGVLRADGTMFVIGQATEVPVIVVTPYENSFLVAVHFDAFMPVVI